MDELNTKFLGYLSVEAEAIRAVPPCLKLSEIVEAITKLKGKLYTTGIGKAGYIARKAASTFSTTGTSAGFIHPGDGPHGDIGVIQAGDLLLAISNSGRTREVLETIHFSRHLGASTIISITADPDSPIALESDFSIYLGSFKEACPLGLTPSSSTAAMSAITDALAFLVLEQRGFTKKDFALRHHGGYLGEKIRRDE